MKIYTRTGDKGKTALLGGKRVLKSNTRIEAYGNIDELNAYLGLIRDHEELKHHFDFLVKIQNELFVIGSHLATEPGKSFNYIPDVSKEIINQLEKGIDSMNEDLPEMKNFILPGGNKLVSFIHIARCVCRRAERSIISLSEKENIKSEIVIFINRLSDYLFVLARWASSELNVKEVIWEPRK